MEQRVFRNQSKKINDKDLIDLYVNKRFSITKLSDISGNCGITVRRRLISLGVKIRKAHEQNMGNKHKNHKRWKKMITLVCKNCKRDFEKPKAMTGKNCPVFCCHKCYIEYLRSFVVFKKAMCKRCGVEFEYKITNRGKSTRAIRDRIYCSHNCQSKNSHWVKPCFYKDKMYRSSWEVEFVKFLESYRLEFEYEPKTFELGNGMTYRPDFYIKNYDCWVEIKGKYSKDAENKIKIFKEKVNKELYVINGGTLFHFFWWIQEVFNRHFFNNECTDLETKQNLTKEYVVHLMAEVTEILNTVNWKMHQDKKSNDVIKSQMMSELSDVFKYTVGLAQIWGYSSDDILQGLIRKSKMVELKYCYGRELGRLKDKKVIACDIDGVLNDYPNNFMRFINKKIGKSFNDYRIAKKQLEPKLLIDLKTEFRETGEEALGDVNQDSRFFLKQMKKTGRHIILLTARPKDIHPDLFYRTWDWLYVNNFCYDSIYFSKYKHLEIIKKVPNLEFMIEDNLEYANQISARGFKVFLINNIYNQGQVNENIIRVDSLKEIVDKI
jgi:uncharacterized HAD superfamily protein